MPHLIKILIIRTLLLTLDTLQLCNLFRGNLSPNGYGFLKLTDLDPNHLGYQPLSLDLCFAGVRGLSDLFEQEIVQGL